MKHLNEQQKQFLFRLGFEPVQWPTYDMLFGDNYSRECNFFVRGDHAYDVVDIVYSTAEGVEGFCYSPSILNAVSEWGGDEWVRDLLNRLIKQYESPIRVVENVFHDYTLVIPYEITEESKHNYVIDQYLSELAKLAAVIDYFAAPRYWELNDKLFGGEEE